MGMMLFEVIADVLQVCRGRERPANAHHSGAQHLLEAGVHLIFFDELATVSLRNAFTHDGAEAGFFLKKPQRGVFHQVCGIGP